MAEDSDDIPEKPDYSSLSIADLLTRLQRQHIENLLALAEAKELPNAQVLAQINRYLMDNGIVVLTPPGPKQIEGHVNQPGQLEPPRQEPLPQFDTDYDE
jgi:hypothetical protein